MWGAGLFWRYLPEAAGTRLGRHLGRSLREKSRVSNEEAVFTVNWTENCGAAPCQAKKKKRNPCLKGEVKS